MVPFLFLCQKLSLSLLYLNKILLHKSSKWSSLVSGPRSNTSPPETMNPGLIHGSQHQPFRTTSTEHLLNTGIRVKSLQSCLTLCDPMDCSPPGSFVHGILQARILEWVAAPSSGSSWSRIEHMSPVALALQADSLLLSHLGSLLKTGRRPQTSKKWKLISTKQSMAKDIRKET